MVKHKRPLLEEISSIEAVQEFWDSLSPAEYIEQEAKRQHTDTLCLISYLPLG